jgi:hypothetical protein
MHMSFMAQLTREVLPATFHRPDQVAIVRSLARTGHVRARIEGEDGHAMATVTGVTPLGAKVASCYSQGASSRLATTFWAFRVHEAEARPAGPER